MYPPATNGEKLNLSPGFSEKISPLPGNMQGDLNNYVFSKKGRSHVKQFVPSPTTVSHPIIPGTRSPHLPGR